MCKAEIKPGSRGVEAGGDQPGGVRLSGRIRIIKVGKPSEIKSNPNPSEPTPVSECHLHVFLGPFQGR